MTICFVCNEYPEGPHGGIGTMTQLLAEELVKHNHAVKVIGVYDKSYPSPVFEIKNGVEVSRIKVNYQSKPAMIFGFWRLARQIRVWIKNGKTDIVESPDSYGLFSLFAGFSRPLVLRANGNNTYFSSILNLPLKKQTFLYERNLYRRAFSYVSVSEFTAGRTSEVFGLKKPFTIIYNGIPTPDLPESQKVAGEISNYPNPFVFSGTLIRKKGIYELVEAVKSVLDSGESMTLFINGKDTVNPITGISVKQELSALIPENYRHHFRFNGHLTRQELISQYRNARAAIFPSYAEAFALAPMESLALGCPTIFSDQTSGKELIEDKVDGLLINPYDPASIAAAITRIIRDPSFAQKVGENGRLKAQQFTASRMCTESIGFYQKCIEQYKKTHGKRQQ